MSRVLAVATREFASFFRIPLGWVVIALFLCLSAVFFAQRTLVPGEPAEMRTFFGVWWFLLLFVTPAVSMRLVSEELRTGTIEPLLTAPVSEWTIVFGKYFAAVGFLAAMLLPSLVFVGVLEFLARPDYGAIGAGYLGLLLLGMLYLAVGTLPRPSPAARRSPSSARSSACCFSTCTVAAGRAGPSHGPACSSDSAPVSA